MSGVCPHASYWDFYHSVIWKCYFSDVLLLLLCYQLWVDNASVCNFTAQSSSKYIFIVYFCSILYVGRYIARVIPSRYTEMQTTEHVCFLLDAAQPASKGIASV